MSSLFLPELHLLVTQASKLSSAEDSSVYFSQHLPSQTLSSASTSLKQYYLPNDSISFSIFICCFLAALYLQFSGFILINLVLWYQAIQHNKVLVYLRRFNTEIWTEMIMSVEIKRLQVKVKHAIPIFLMTSYAKCTSQGTVQPESF